MAHNQTVVAGEAGHPLFSLLAELSALPGASGHEHAVARRVGELLAPSCPSVKYDALGNCIALRPG